MRVLALVAFLLLPLIAAGFTFSDAITTGQPLNNSHLSEIQARLDAMDDCTAAQALSGAGANTAPTCRAVPTVVATDSVVVDPGSIGTQACATAAIPAMNVTVHYFDIDQHTRLMP